MIRAWDRYWFGPVAGVRPYLILKIVLCLLAFDVWRHRIPLGWEYGANGFNVAQFYWLDAVQPVPGPELYVGLMLTVGIIALVCALTDPGRWARALLAVLFSYGWLMSLLNVYQHYYLLSLVLIAFVFFPRSRAQDLYALPAVRPTASAWAYRLLGVTLAIVYLFTVVTKLDAEWQAGHILRRLATPALHAGAAWAETRGVSADTFWTIQALGAIFSELIVAVGYVLAPPLDDRGRRWRRAVAWVAWLTAVGFHGSAQFLLGLEIGWFSYYMMAFACVYFLPDSLLWAAGVPLARTAAWFAALRSAAWLPFRTTGRTVPVSVNVITIAAVSGLVGAVGFALDLPGARAAGLVIASILVGVALVALAVGRLPDATIHALATGLATLLMWAAVTLTGARFDYYTDLGRFLEAQGEDTAALAAFEQARRYQPAHFR